MIKSVTTDRLNDITGLWLIFSHDKILVREGDERPPMGGWQQFSFLKHYAEQVFELPPLTPGSFSERPVFMLDLGGELPEQLGWECVSLRTLLAAGTESDFGLFARAWQYVHFLRTHRFCGQCGGRTERVSWEMAVQCHQCKHRSYPRISPCIIVAIYRKGQILLAKGVRHKASNMYSTLAGFVESGEKLEEAVHREVLEEVGVRIKNLRYFGSQPWPFPHSLMMGYLAEYDSGDIVCEEGEIDDAQWFDLDDLPIIPPKLSIAGRLIEAVLKGQ